MFGDLEKTCSVIFGNNASSFWRNRSAILEKRFGDNVGVLEKRGRRGYGDFVLEFATKQHSARRP